GDRTRDAVHRGGRLALQRPLPGAAEQPEPRDRCGAEQAAGRATPRDGSGQAPRDRLPDPASPGRQGLLRLLAGHSPVHLASALCEGLQAPRRLRHGVASHVHLARSMTPASTIVPTLLDRMWSRITRTLIDTGRPPHYAELARWLGVSPRECRT